MAKIVKKQEIKEERSSNVVVKLPKRMFQYALIVLVVVGLIYFGTKMFFAASVNGQLINRLTVIKELEKQGGQKTLDTIILKTLIGQEAKKRKLSVSAADVSAEISKIEKNVTSQGTTLDALLQQQGMTKSDLEDEIRIQLLVTKMVDNNITVTDKEVTDYLESQKQQTSLSSAQPAPELTKDQAVAAIKQQKLQAEIQKFVADLKAKAKINYFVKY
ncbi:MAG: SurA N-terminal domain-containing protein [Patescibacteria group bacterium]|jgi:foldase protein PrsA